MRTPGPWEVIPLPSGQYRIDAKLGPLHVCPAIAHGLSDAVLISAAPDLLEALAGWLPIAERQMASIPPMPESEAYQYALRRIERSRAAIAKAKGIQK